MTQEEKNKLLNELESIRNETHRMTNICKSSNLIIENIDKRFNDITSFDKNDWSFLFFATSLQIVRQYFLTKFTDSRMSDQEAANDTWGHSEEHSDRHHRWYRPTLDEIITNPVPFDVIYGSKDWNLGLHGTKHRYKTLGHDPILGLKFGTMNILTSTVTLYNLESYHVKTGYTSNGARRDKVTNKANLATIYRHTKRRAFDEGKEGKIALGSAFLKECIHLRTDVKSKQSLEIPFISRVDPQFAEDLANYGLDMLNIETFGKQITISMLINNIIAMTHRLFKPSTISSSLYGVKTRKILLYSNSIATSSNIVYTAISDNYKNLDLGGLMVTLYRLFTDLRYIDKIKGEFISDEFQEILDNNKNIYGF